MDILPLVAADDYYALVYLRGCGELIQEHVSVDESEPGYVTLTITVHAPERAE